MKRQIMQVKSFQSAVDAPMPEKPIMLDHQRAYLRNRLLVEEVQELADAKDLVDVADAITDSMYILIGTAHEYGLADRIEMCFDEVHISNMTKFPEGKAVFNEYGKVVKPDSFRPPKLDRIINRDFSQYKEGSHLREILKQEADAWKIKVEKAIYDKLSWWDKLRYKVLDSIENSFKKKLSVVHSADTIHRNVVTIIYKGQKEEMTDY